MSQKRVFMEVTGDGSENTPYKPDVPTDDNGNPLVGYEVIGCPCIIERQNPKKGEPIPSYVLVEISDQDVGNINAISPEQVDGSSKLIAQAFPTITNPNDIERMADKDNDDTAEACFEGVKKKRHRNKIDNSIIHRRRWARLLVRLCRRGFPIEKARHIVHKHGIDRDEHNRGTQTSESGTQTTQPGGQQDATAGGTRE